MLYVVVNSLIGLLLLSGCSPAIDTKSLFAPSPQAPDSLAVTPVSPSSNKTPTVTGNAPASVSLKLYSGSSCSGSVVGTGTASSTGVFSITSSTLAEGSYNFSVQASNSGGLTCSASSVAYVVDITPPTIRFAAPSASLVNSTSPAVSYYVTYLGASTVNLTAADVNLVVTGSATCSSKTVANGTSFIATVSLSGCTGSGTVGISIAAGTASDSAGNVAGASSTSGLFNVDNSGPSTATYSPDTGIYGVVPSSVTITFSEVISGTSVSASDFSVTGTCGTLPTLVLTSAIGSAATVSLSGAVCAAGETTIITTNLAGINDAAGNAGTGSVSATYTIDNVGPTSAIFNPVTARFSSIPASVDVTFNEAVTTASVTSADFAVTGTCTTLPVVSVTNVSGTLANLSLSGAVCSLDQTVILSVDLSGINDLTGNAGAGIFSETYTFDNIGPAAISINPATSSVSSIPANVDVIFDENLLASSVTAADLIVAGTCTTLPTVSLTSVNAAMASFALTGSSCSVGQTVIVTLNGPSVTDAAGNVGSGSVNATFTFDNIGPVISSTSPVSGTMNAIPASVTVFFNEALLPSSVTSTDVAISGTCSTLPTASLLSISGSTAVFSLLGAVCSNGQAVVLTMNGSSVTDAAANAGTGSVTTTYTIDSVGPSPLSILPNTANLISMPTTVSVNFDKSILASSVSSTDLVISGTCATLPTAYVSGVAGSVVTFTLMGDSCVDGETVTVSASGADVTDLTGNAGSNNQIATYTKDTTGPSVSSFSPATNTFMSLPTLVNITFSESLLASSVSAADFSVSGSCVTLPVASVLSVSGQQVLLNLSGGICNDGENTIITVNDSGISDTAGNPGVGTTAVTYTIDNIGPTLSSVSPNTGAPPAAVFFNFSENLNPSSVSLSDFTLGGTCAAILSLTAVTNNVVELAVDSTACLSGETVEISINAATVTDVVGNSGSGSNLVIFTQP